MKRVLIVEPPKNCWEKGYPVHQGKNEYSLNKTTLNSNQNKIFPDIKRLHSGFNELKETLVSLGINFIALPFPDNLDKSDSPCHDGVFIRDSGMMFKNYWIKANFSATSRQIEAEVYAEIIKQKFQKEIISLPENAFLEFGETIYLETSKGSFYFGGLSRANKAGHDFLKELIKPDHYCLINSKGYHLDTVFSSVINKNNELVALIVAKNMLDQESYKKLEKLNIEIIDVDNKDSSDEDGLGNYAINGLVDEGVRIGGSAFTTSIVQERFNRLGIKFFVVPLTDFHFAGGSAHCLTNEI